MIRACKCLEGPNLAPQSVKEARCLIGSRVEYLLDGDICNRGYRPRRGTITAAEGKNIEIGGDWLWRPRIRELIVLPPDPPQDQDQEP